MAVFSIIDVKMFILRVVIFFLVLGLMLMMFVALGEITKGSELDRKLNEIGESMLGSDFTIARAVFDPNKPAFIQGLGYRSMVDINRTEVEPLHYCDYLVQFSFSVRQGDKFVEKYKFGASDNAVSGGSERKWTIWMKTTNGIIPAVMDIKLNERFVTALSCAIERVWLYKVPITVSGMCAFSQLIFLDYSTNGTLCVTCESGSGYNLHSDTYCKYLNGAPLTVPFIKMGTRNFAIYPIKGVQKANETCESPTTFQNDIERNTYNVSKIIICGA